MSAVSAVGGVCFSLPAHTQAHQPRTLLLIEKSSK